MQGELREISRHTQPCTANSALHPYTRPRTCFSALKSGSVCSCVIWLESAGPAAARKSHILGSRSTSCTRR